MDSVVKFLIKLQADGGNVLSVARQTTRQLDAISARARSAGAGLREAFSFSNFKGSLMSIPGMQFLMNPYTMLAAGLGAVTSLGAEAEKTGVAFRVLVGDEEKAADLLGRINDFAAATPFSKLNLEKAAQTMLNFGVGADSVMGKLKMLGDISMGDAQKLDSLALVHGQVEAAGKLSGQDLLQFINAGFNPLEELQKMTGKSYQELQDLMSKGAVTAENVAQAMAHATGEGGRFHGMMEAQSKTLSGMWSTAVGSIQQKAAAIFPRIEEMLMTLIGGFQTVAGSVLDVVDSFALWFTGLQPVWGILTALITLAVDGFGWLAGVVGGAVALFFKFRTEVGYMAAVVGIATVAFNLHTIALTAMKGVQLAVIAVTHAWTAAQWLLNAALNANPIGWVVLVISALVAAVVCCWNKFAGFRAFILTMWDVMKGFGGIIKAYVIDRFKELLGGLGDLGSALLKLFSGDFDGAKDSALSGFKKLSGKDSAAAAAGRVADLASSSWQRNYMHERLKDTVSGSHAPEDAPGGITPPALAGSPENVVFGNGSGGKDGKNGKGGAHKTAEAAATGGQRNTSITMHIAKFFDNINVYMADKADTAGLEQAILGAMNRALAIATGTDR